MHILSELNPKSYSFPLPNPSIDSQSRWNQKFSISLSKQIVINTLVFLFLINCSPKEVNLQEFIASQDKITIIQLNHKRFTDSLEQIGKISSLNEIEMNYDGISAIPENWSELSNLSKLSLYGNQIEDLPTSIHKLQNLEILILGKNPLNKIPNSIQGLPNLRILSLDETKIQLTEEDIQVLASLPKLEILDISENPYLVRTPKNIKDLNFIKTILLKKNKMSEEERKKMFYALPNVSLSK